MSRELVATALDRDVSVTVTPLPGGRYRVAIADRVYEVDARRARAGTWSLLVAPAAQDEAPAAAHASFLVDVDRPGAGDGRADEALAVDVATGGMELAVAVQDARRRRLSQALSGRERTRPGGEVIRAPIAGVVVAIAVAVGDHVEPGDAVCVLEAMKMENELKCERGGVVTAVDVATRQSVEAGDALITLA